MPMLHNATTHLVAGLHRMEVQTWQTFWQCVDNASRLYRQNAWQTCQPVTPTPVDLLMCQSLTVFVNTVQAAYTEMLPCY